MRNFLITLAAVILSTAGHLIAGPIVQKYISADADWVIHADYEQFNKSHLGQAVRSELASRGIEEQFKNFKEVFSCHPIDDINNITIYGQGNDRNKAVTLIRGQFDKNKLLELVGKNPKYEQIEYHGIKIHQWNQQEKTAAQNTKEQTMFGCFYNNNMVVLSSGLPAIEQAVGVLEGSRASAASDFFNQMTINSANVMFQATVKNISETVGKNPHALLLRRTRQLALTIGENENNIIVNITLKADSKETAEYMKKILDGITAYLALTEEEQPEFVKIAQKTKISNLDDTVQINLEIEPEIVKRLALQQLP
jgi:hypothetical protein